jgi:hypothetical protein
MDFARSRAEKKESSAAKVPRLRMNDGERKSRGHGRVDRIAACLHHLDPCTGGEFVTA